MFGTGNADAIPALERIAYEKIHTEREYQRVRWPGGENRSAPVLSGITLLRKYLQDFEAHYAQDEDAPGCDVPRACLDDVRKMAAILVRVIEQTGVPPRVVT